MKSTETLEATFYYLSYDTDPDAPWSRVTPSLSCFKKEFKTIPKQNQVNIFEFDRFISFWKETGLVEILEGVRLPFHQLIEVKLKYI